MVMKLFLGISWISRATNAFIRDGIEATKFTGQNTDIRIAGGTQIQDFGSTER